MQIHQPTFNIITEIDQDHILRHIEKCARKCYKSEDKISEDSHKNFIKLLLNRKHESTIEHYSITVEMYVSRQVTHEIVRHRLCSFSQESTRYVNYSKDKYGNSINVIKPFYFQPDEERKLIKVPRYSSDGLIEDEFLMNSFDIWLFTHHVVQWGYLSLINNFKRKPQEAAGLLTNSTASDISITANIREWRHVIDLRCDPACHPQMRQIMLKLLNKLYLKLPILFGDIYDKYKNDIIKWNNI